jgi:hypothetical protein
VLFARACRRKISFESSRNRNAGKAEPIEMRSNSSVIKASTSALTPMT